MADKKLIDNSSSTTVDNFYGNKGGADVQIPLAQAASVLAASMGNPFVNRGGLTSSDSVINTSLQTGYYATLSYDTASDLPSGVTNKSGLLLIFVNNYARRFLIWINAEGALYLRVYWDSSWQEWTQM